MSTNRDWISDNLEGLDTEILISHIRWLYAKIESLEDDLRSEGIEP